MARHLADVALLADVAAYEPFVVVVALRRIEVGTVADPFERRRSFDS